MYRKQQFIASTLIVLIVYHTGRKCRGVFNFSRFSWVADDTKIIHVEGGIITREVFEIRQNLELHEIFHPRNFPPVG